MKEVRETLGEGCPHLANMSKEQDYKEETGVCRKGKCLFLIHNLMLSGFLFCFVLFFGGTWV
jgi:hypothetical protein